MARTSKFSRIQDIHGMLRAILGCCYEPTEEIDFKELLSDVSVGSSTAAVEPGSVGLEGSTRVVEWDELKEREHLGSGAFCDLSLIHISEPTRPY